jgi:hypothetical protein
MPSHTAAARANHVGRGSDRTMRKLNLALAVLQRKWDTHHVTQKVFRNTYLLSLIMWHVLKYVPPAGGHAGFEMSPFMSGVRSFMFFKQTCSRLFYAVDVVSRKPFVVRRLENTKPLVEAYLECTAKYNCTYNSPRDTSRDTSRDKGSWVFAPKPVAPWRDIDIDIAPFYHRLPQYSNDIDLFCFNTTHESVRSIMQVTRLISNCLKGRFPPDQAESEAFLQNPDKRARRLLKTNWRVPQETRAAWVTDTQHKSSSRVKTNEQKRTLRR